MKQILIIENEASYRNALVDLINSNGFKAEGVTSCKGAMEILDKQDFNLIITSLYMPCVNGFELVERLNEFKPFIPIVVTSSYLDVKAYDTILELGAFECHSKPINLDKFLKIIHRGVFENGFRKSGLRREG